MAKKIIIASGKGGVGKSSVTVSLARALSATGKTVLCIDCDIGLRSLDLLFGISKDLVFDWGDIVLENCEKEKAVMQSGDIRVLAAPLSTDASFTPDAMRAMVMQFDEEYDYILIDAPAGISEDFRFAAAMADAGIIVATPDEVCLRSASRAADTLRALGVAELRLIINRFHRAAVEHNFLMNVDESIDRTGVQLLGVVPEDAEIMFRLPRGEKLPKKSNAALALQRIADRMEGKTVPLRIKKGF